MPARIFISYRRDDVAGDARGIRDGLAARFGRGSVFMDVDDLLAGQRFDEELPKALDTCDVLIAVIGPRWMDLLRARTASNEPDYVRAEIAEALRRRIVAIPVRVGREGQMPALPRPEELPDDLRDLVYHQKHDVTHERFGRDLADLVQAIGDIRNMRQPRRGRRPGNLSWGRVGVAVAVVIALVWGAVYWAGGGEKSRMARYEITAPDGSRYEVTAPASMSEADVLARFRSEMALKELGTIRKKAP